LTAGKVPVIDFLPWLQASSCHHKERQKGKSSKTKQNNKTLHMYLSKTKHRILFCLCLDSSIRLVLVSVNGVCDILLLMMAVTCFVWITAVILLQIPALSEDEFFTTEWELNVARQKVSRLLMSYLSLFSS